MRDYFFATLVLIGLLMAMALDAKAGVKVAVIDTGLDLKDVRLSGHLCRYGHKDFTGTGIQDNNGHGTHIAGLIQEYAGDADYCMVIVKFFDDSAKGLQNISRMNRALDYAISLGVQVINISGGGPEMSETEMLAIRDARNITFVVAGGNEGANIEKQPYYPASYRFPNIVAVGNMDSSGYRVPSSNFAGNITTWEVGENVLSLLPNGQRGYMTGTSQATAIHTGKILAGKCSLKICTLPARKKPR